MAGYQTITATIASVSPLTVHIPGDPPGVDVPVQNASTKTFTSSDVSAATPVRVQVLPGGQRPQITGPLTS